jgi:hypothetical protein
VKNERKWRHKRRESEINGKGAQIGSDIKRKMLENIIKREKKESRRKEIKKEAKLVRKGVRVHLQRNLQRASTPIQV